MAPLTQTAALRPADNHHDDESDMSDSSNEGPLDLTKEDGWEDMEPDEEKEPIVGLFNNKVFPDVQSMLNDCKENFDFDFVKVQKVLELDFLGTIKLVNYIRSEVKAGNTKPDVTSASLFDDEKYLMPVLEDDALLYSLDDISDGGEDGNEPEQISDSAAQVQNLKAELNQLREEFGDYKHMVQRAMDKNLKTEIEKDASSASAGPRDSDYFRTNENNYFSSYSGNEIHELMLKDTVRTDAYRDFIYDNKNLFKDKVVLDVGCGTGILSMFCAKAGAKQVIAVDNSDIIERTRAIVYENGFGDVIKCMRGKIEEVLLPVKQVDIIVSEWMGYCLLFEAMLDSVIWARDRYLAPDGLMVPSHATLRIAPLSYPEFVQDNISFWKSVYGFKMSSMLQNVHDEAFVRCLSPSALAGESAPFLQLPLHTISTAELIFTKEFSVTLAKDIDTLDGWTIWFDIFFMTSRNKDPAADAVPSSMKKQDLVAFTTGPDGPDTHWQQGIFLINDKKNPALPLKKGQAIKGSVEYQKKKEGSRFLDIDIKWDMDGVGSGSQEWALH